MNDEYAVLCNRSLERLFGAQCHAVAEALGRAPCYTNTDFLGMRDEEIRFRKCVYFDKDVILGLRLELLGIKLYNNIGSIELCDDKRRTCELLRQDFRIPETITSPLLFSDDPAFVRQYAEQVADRLGFPLVAKEAFGSLGQQVHLVGDFETLLAYCEKWQRTPHLFQKFIASSKGRDVRLYVVDGVVEGAMERSNPTDFRSNIASGGRGEKIDPPDEFCRIAVDACGLLGLHFGGVDLLYADDGEPYLCEVNSNALFTTLNQVCGVKIEEKIAAAVKKEQLSLF